jgi:hypothetical protein
MILFLHTTYDDDYSRWKRPQTVVIDSAYCRFTQFTTVNICSPKSLSLKFQVGNIRFSFIFMQTISIQLRQVMFSVKCAIRCFISAAKLLHRTNLQKKCSDFYWFWTQLKPADALIDSFPIDFSHARSIPSVYLSDQCLVARMLKSTLLTVSLFSIDISSVWSGSTKAAHGTFAYEIKIPINTSKDSKIQRDKRRKKISILFSR